MNSQPISIKSIFNQFIFKNKFLVGLYVTLFVAIIIERIIFPHFYGKIVQIVSDNKNSRNIFSSCKPVIIVIIILLIIGQAFWTSVDYLNSIMIPKIQTFFRNAIFEKIISTYKSQYQDLEIGDILAKVIKLPQTVRDLFHQSIYYIIPAIIVVIFSIGYFYIINPKLGTVSLVVLGLFILLIFVFSKKCLPGSINRDKYHNYLHEQMGDTLNNLMSIYTFNKDQQEKRKIDQYTYKLDANYSSDLQCTTSFKLTYSIFFIFIFLSVNGYAFYLTYHKQISLGQLVSVLFIITYLLDSAQCFCGEIKDVLYNIGVLNTSKKYLDQLFNYNQTYSSISQTPLNYKFKFTSGHIKFQRITYTYPHTTKKILHNFNLTIPAGQTLAIMGNIGSGKSTITKLLLRFYQPQSGYIMIDNYHLAKLAPEMVRQQIAYIPQNTKLFNRTVYENIIYGNYKSKSDIITLIKQLRLNHIFKNVDQLLDKRCGKNGDNLSGGQRQIICFLRTLINLDRYQIIIFDEPTSALDQVSKQHIMDLIKLIAKNRTCLIVCHDPDMLQIVDRQIYLENGQIIKDQLMSK